MYNEQISIQSNDMVQNVSNIETGMKIIFLDIDGVLNSDRSIAVYPYIARTGIYWYDYLYSKFDPVAIQLLNQITDETNAMIVITSANRKDISLDTMRELFYHSGVTGCVFSETRILHTLRGIEIEEWLSRHEVSNYVIIDDSKQFSEDQLENFVHVDGRYGLSLSNAFDAKRILGCPVSSLIIPK